MARNRTLIGIDWGTTACRAYLIADGAVQARADGPGILRVENGAFGPVLRAMIDPWIGDRMPPILLSGMIGSRQGWVEVPYVACPAAIEELAAGLGCIDAPGFGSIAVVPGMTVTAGDMPDVMRGEETQVFGALALSGRADGLFLLPGTHSKWVEVTGGRIVAFRTFMTGEIFAALKDHTILGRLMRASEGDADGFARGVAEGAALGGAGALLNRLFAVRTYGLFDRLPDKALADYLSGLLIGAEIAEATAGGRHDIITIIATPALAVRYANALRQLGHRCVTALEDCVAAGHWQLAARRAAGPS
jgi:2-dehydro-3-deoxygalactonokinase